MVGTPSSIRYAPPLLGQHTEEVLKEYLGLNAAAVEKLRHQKVIT
jgi:crotonobetainyl-CoA:carnitine CoA-transferase CaiB-like acyl-CoA transferase